MENNIGIENLSWVFSYLEDEKKVNCEYHNKFTIYRHPQYASRCLIVDDNRGDYDYLIRCVKVTDAFRDKWDIEDDNIFPYSGDKQAMQEMFDDFFQLEDLLVYNSQYTFEEAHAECKQIICTLCSRYACNKNYELNTEDLYSVATTKMYECWLLYSDKPMPEFKKLVARCVLNKFKSMFSKHFFVQTRASGDLVPIDDVMEEKLPAPPSTKSPFYSKYSKGDLEDVMLTWGEQEKYLINQVLDPHPLVRRDFWLQTLRYNQIIKHSNKRRIINPKIRLSVLERLSVFSGQQLKNAVDTIKEKLDNNNILTTLIDNG